MKKIFLIAGTIILLFITFFTSIFLSKNFVNSSLGFLKKYFKVDFYQENVSLKIENENLKTQLQQIKSLYSFDGEAIKNLPANFIAAQVFSTYPFNVKDVIVIDKGSSNGISKGMIATLGEGILIGQVVSLDGDSANIRTVFDPNWQLPVKIGDDKINGLFKGGADPKITLIEKPVKVGDAVFASSKDLGYEMKIGEIREIHEDTGGIFKEAIVKTPYSINDLNLVYMIK